MVSVRRTGTEAGATPVSVEASGLVVETSHLTKIYQDRQIALNDMTLGVEPGTVLGLLGPSPR